MADFDHSFQKLIEEAFRACGPDRAAIEQYVFRQIEATDDETRERLLRDIDLVLGFRAPGFKEDDQDN